MTWDWFLAPSLTHWVCRSNLLQFFTCKIGQIAIIIIVPTPDFKGLLFGSKGINSVKVLYRLESDIQKIIIFIHTKCFHNSKQHLSGFCHFASRIFQDYPFRDLFPTRCDACNSGKLLPGAVLPEKYLLFWQPSWCGHVLTWPTKQIFKLLDVFF